MFFTRRAVSLSCWTSFKAFRVSWLCPPCKQDIANGAGGTSVWNTRQVNLLINKGKTITINLDNQATSNHFQGQPIYGVVESMKDSAGKEKLKAQQQAVQRTEK